jgi:hypothetical protein
MGSFEYPNCFLREAQNKRSLQVRRNGMMAATNFDGGSTPVAKRDLINDRKICESVCLLVQM